MKFRLERKFRMEQGNKYRWVGRFVLVAFAIAFCYLMTSCGELNYKEIVVESSRAELPGPEETAEPVKAVLADGVTARVDYGFNHIVKVGRKLVVRVTVDNSQKSDWNGTFRVWQLVNQEQWMAYEKEISVLAESVLNTELCFLPVSPDAYIFSFQDNATGRSVDTKRQSASLIYGDSVFAGVLTDTFDDYSYLSGEESYAAPLFLEELPLSYQGLDALDFILVGEGGERLWKDEQKEALLRYVEEGGTLAAGRETAAELLSEFSLNQFSKREAMQLRKDGNLAETEENIRLVSADASWPDSGWYVRYDYGKGTILLFGDRLSMAYDMDGNFAGAVYRAILAELGSEKQKQMAREWLYDDFTYYKILSVDSVGENLPNIKVYVILIALYLFFIGPVSYVVLRRLELQKFLWGVIPGFALLFSGILFFVGARTRITEPYISYLTLQSYQDQVVEESTLFSAVSPDNRPYEIFLPEPYRVQVLGSLYQTSYMNDEELTENDPAVTVLEQEEGTRLGIDRLSSFTTLYVKEDHSRPEEIKTPGSVMYQNYQVSGTVTNTLPFDLSHAFLCVENTVVYLGDLGQDETVDTSECRQEVVGNIRMLYDKEIIERLVGSKLYEGKYNARRSREYKALQYYFYQHFSTVGSKGSFLVGIADGEIPEVIAEIGEQQTGITISQAEVAVEEGGFSPSLDSFCTYSGANINYYRTLQNSGVQGDVQFPANWQIEKIIYGQEANSEFMKRTRIGFRGTVSAWNYRFGRYDKIFRGGVSKEWSKLEDYLDSNNCMKLWFQNTNQKEQWEELLPVLGVSWSLKETSDLIEGR